ncbi:hypothetical protein HS088_TW05G00738 [Tripterygium wilfordii]|uniref:non-specific serine/threonine protein kinase n=1 Tax=Tripterygium wilfordii TaxID=458696 RepID=A0A7J7DPI5_TRIWF|nr:hypothetical protein HS088_TW05G00738 [Tripterygium wilfordii]
MDSWVFFSFPLPFFPSLLILCLLSPCLSQTVADNYSACSNQFQCGKITAGYPFFGGDRPAGCGNPGLKLSCRNNNKARININNLTYQVLGIDEGNQILRVAREDYLNSGLTGFCSSELANTTLDSSLFEFDSGVGNITLYYGCLPSIAQAFRLPSVCNKSGLVYAVYAQSGESWNADCSDHVIVPTSEAIVIPILDISTLERALNDGFQVRWKVDGEACRECSDSEGACGIDSSNQTVCFCPNQTSPLKTCLLTPTSATATTGITSIL